MSFTAIFKQTNKQHKNYFYSNSISKSSPRLSSHISSLAHSNTPNTPAMVKSNSDRYRSINLPRSSANASTCSRSVIPSSTRSTKLCKLRQVIQTNRPSKYLNPERSSLWRFNPINMPNHIKLILKL